MDFPPEQYFVLTHYQDFLSTSYIGGISMLPKGVVHTGYVSYVPATVDKEQLPDCSGGN